MNIKIPTQLNRSTKLTLLLILILIVLYISLPWFLASNYPQDNYPNEFISESVVVEILNEKTFATQGIPPRMVTDRYLLLTQVQGKAPATDFVGLAAGLVARGSDSTDFSVGQTIHTISIPMNEETFFGDQYLFFDKPQVYIHEVKNKGFWPHQKAQVRSAYLAPVNVFIMPLLLIDGEYNDYFKEGGYLYLTIFAVLLFLSIGITLKYKHNPLIPIASWLFYAVVLVLTQRILLI